jgi:hypothetical protein
MANAAAAGRSAHHAEEAAGRDRRFRSGWAGTVSVGRRKPGARRRLSVSRRPVAAGRVGRRRSVAILWRRPVTRGSVFGLGQLRRALLPTARSIRTRTGRGADQPQRHPRRHPLRARASHSASRAEAAHRRLPARRGTGQRGRAVGRRVVDRSGVDRHRGRKRPCVGEVISPRVRVAVCSPRSSRLRAPAISPTLTTCRGRPCVPERKNRPSHGSSCGPNRCPKRSQTHPHATPRFPATSGFRALPAVLIRPPVC